MKGEYLPGAKPIKERWPEMLEIGVGLVVLAAIIWGLISSKP